MPQNARNNNRIGNYRNPRLRPIDSEWEWQLEGACREVDASVFYGPANETRRARRKREITAKTVCLRCPVRLTCLKHALDIREPHGVWGGMTETERHAIRRTSA